ncbi:MAG TPA: BlaI/MecI/CopY family transcriptional regulator [Chthonomonadaceae bacterium]|nr:BlaI/MecI/CopY family transcriptional regulator [Chthonomonadaceae bacterium]
MHFTEKLHRRERQILETVYRLGAASVNDVLAALPDPPSYSAVRTFLRILEEKGLLTHSQEGAKYIYHPTKPRPPVAREALYKLIETFFGGRPEQVVNTLLNDEERKLSQEDLDRLSAMIEAARQKGKE